MNHTQPEAADLLAAARRLGPLIRDRRDESERDRRLPASVLSAMQEARLFRMYVPVEYGGLETDPITSMSRRGRRGGGRRHCMEPDDRRDLRNLGSVLAGGRRARNLRQYRCGCCRWLAPERYRPRRRRWLPGQRSLGVCQRDRSLRLVNGGCVVYEDGAPRPTETGTPQTVLVFFPATGGERIDTWDTAPFLIAATARSGIQKLRRRSITEDGSADAQDTSIPGMNCEDRD
jgi:indole-3-acetate monooxygenase